MPAFKIFATLLTAATHCNWGGEAINTRALKQSHVIIANPLKLLLLINSGQMLGKKGKNHFNRIIYVCNPVRVQHNRSFMVPERCNVSRLYKCIFM